MELIPSAKCFRGCGQTADFLHCFWSCPVVQDFWAEVSSFISSAMGLPNIVHPKNWLLGIFGDLHILSHAKRLLCILYFYVKKSILLSWKGTQTPLKSLWLKLINDFIPLYKLTFELRKRNKTFHKIWGRWIASPLTLTPTWIHYNVISWSFHVFQCLDLHCWYMKFTLTVWSIPVLMQLIIAQDKWIDICLLTERVYCLFMYTNEQQKKEALLTSIIQWCAS